MRIHCILLNGIAAVVVQKQVLFYPQSDNSPCLSVVMQNLVPRRLLFALWKLYTALESTRYLLQQNRVSTFKNGWRRERKVNRCVESIKPYGIHSLIKMTSK